MNLTGWLWDLRRSTSSPDYNSDAVDSIFLHDSMYSTLQQLNNHEASDTKVSTSPDMPSFEDKLDSGGCWIIIGIRGKNIMCLSIKSSIKCFHLHIIIILS
nr:uncharacterized protein LOC112801810 isoform X3 [Arachis hypogaea]